MHQPIFPHLLYSRNDFLYNTHDCKTSALSLSFQRPFRNTHIVLMIVVLSGKAYNIFVCTDCCKIYVFFLLLQSDTLFRTIGKNFLSIPHPYTLLWVITLNFQNVKMFLYMQKKVAIMTTFYFTLFFNKVI